MKSILKKEPEPFSFDEWRLALSSHEQIPEGFFSIEELSTKMNMAYSTVHKYCYQLVKKGKAEKIVANRKNYYRLIKK